MHFTNTYPPKKISFERYEKKYTLSLVTLENLDQTGNCRLANVFQI